MHRLSLLWVPLHLMRAQGQGQTQLPAQAPAQALRQVRVLVQAHGTDRRQAQGPLAAPVISAGEF